MVSLLKYSIAFFFLFLLMYVWLLMTYKHGFCCQRSMNVSSSDNYILRVQFLYVIHDVMNFHEYVNDIDIRVDNVRPDENWVTTEGALNTLKTQTRLN